MHISYICINSGASFRGLHVGIVNYLGNSLAERNDSNDTSNDVAQPGVDCGPTGRPSAKPVRPLNLWP